MKLLNHVLLIISISLLVVGCSENDDANPTITEDIPKGTLRMHLHNFAGTDEIDAPGIIYNRDNRKVSFDLTQFYLSNFQLVKLDGSTYDVVNAKIIKVIDEETYIIGNVPVGNYKSINFNVGLNPTDNKKLPSTESTDILNRPEMWFSSQAQPDGYVFLNLEGKIDTTTAADCTDDKLQAFHYKIGTDANYKKVTMPENDYVITKDATTYIHMYADLSRLFNGIQLNNQANLSVLTPADNNSALAQKITNNMASMFVYE